MDLVLSRKEIGENGCFSDMTDTKGNFLFYCGEHAYLQDDGSYQPKIPKGKWRFNRFFSEKHGYDVFMCNEIPGHTFIECHVGNWPQVDSDGCILIGKGRGFTLKKENMIQDSKNGFKEFMDLQKDSNSFIMIVE